MCIFRPCIAWSIYILKLNQIPTIHYGENNQFTNHFSLGLLASVGENMYSVFTLKLYTADASSAPSSSSMGGACSSFTTSSSPTIYSTSVTDSKAMQVESCSSALGVSNRGVSEKQLTSNTVQQHPSTPKRHTVLYISPPPEDLLDNSRMSCQDEGCGLESEQSCSMWMEDSPPTSVTWAPVPTMITLRYLVNHENEIQSRGRGSNDEIVKNLIWIYLMPTVPKHLTMCFLSLPRTTKAAQKQEMGWYSHFF